MSSFNYKLIIPFLLIGNIIHCQNIVPNGNFELLDVCPNNMMIDEFEESLTNWQNPGNIPASMPPSSSPDCFNVCAGATSATSNGTVGFEFFGVPYNFIGNEAPHSGSSYAGIVTHSDLGVNRKEFISIELTSALLANEQYTFSFYTSCAEGNVEMMGTDNPGFSTKLSVYFSSTIPGVATLPTSVPQFTTNSTIDLVNGWQLITGVYVAQGGEKFMTIGNWEYNSPQLGFATGISLAQQQSAEIAYYFIDDVEVVKVSEQTPVPIDCDKELFIPNVFSPNENKVDDNLCLFNTSCYSNIEFSIYNTWGELMFFSNSSEVCWDGKYKGEELPTGVYVYTFKAKNAQNIEVKLKGNIQLLK